MSNKRRPKQIVPEFVALTVMFGFACVVASIMVVFSDAAGRDLIGKVCLLTGVITVISATLALCVRR